MALHSKKAHSEKVKRKLMKIISDMASNKDSFVNNPGKDFTRNRKLSFEDLIKFILSMGGGSINKELLNHFGFNTNVVSASAYTQQRDKLLPEAFKYLLYEFTQSFDLPSLHKGYRLVAVDGSDLHTPHDPKDTKTYYKTAPTNKGYNMIHITAMYDLCSRIYLDACIQPSRKQGETGALTHMVDNSTLGGKVIILADRAFENFNTFAHIEKKGWKYLIRAKDIDSNGILSTLGLPDEEHIDRVVEIILTQSKRNFIKDSPSIYKLLPKKSNFDYLRKAGQECYPMKFRVVRIKMNDDTIQTFITNLEQDTFSTADISNLYHMRWGIETSFRELKHTVGLTSLHSKKMACIYQEVFARMVMYNFCEIITLGVIIQQKSRKHGYRINFSMAMTVCRHFLKTLDRAHPPDVEALIQKHISPIRPGRSCQRKIKTKSFVHFNYRIA